MRLIIRTLLCRYSRYHNEYCRVVWSINIGRGHMQTALKLFGGLDPESLEPMHASKDECAEIVQKCNMSATGEGGDWKTKSRFVLNWILGSERYTMCTLLAANKHIFAIRTGTTDGYSDIEGSTYGEKLATLKAALGKKALMNFVLVLIADIGGLYASLAGIGNHPYFAKVSGPPSMALKNDFVVKLGASWF